MYVIFMGDVWGSEELSPGFENGQNRGFNSWFSIGSYSEFDSAV
jgi:hypothetical protein